MFYLVDDDRPDQPVRRCLQCGSEETPRGEYQCVACGSPIPERRQYLLSTRWVRDSFSAALEFHQKGLVHPGMLTPEDVFIHDGLLCSVVPYNHEALMLDESSPFEMERILHLAQRFAGLMAFLHHHGVALAGFDRSSFVFRPDEDRFFLFDPAVLEIHEDPVPEHLRGREIGSLAGMLKRFVPINLPELFNFFESAEEGAFTNPMEFGHAVEEVWDKVRNRPMPVGLAALTDVGLVRTLNEDNWSWAALDDGVYLYAVADGMGGHESGEVASEVAAHTICRVARDRFRATRDRSSEAIENILDEAFQTANNTVKGMAEERRNDMGTTLVSALVTRNLGLLANVGDSRAYLMREGVLYQVSRDHSLVARMVEQNRLTSEEARNHPHSNILLRTVGTERNVEIDIFRVDLEPGDRLLLCSDGLWGEVPDEVIESILNHFVDSRICARELLRAAHRGGGKDNVTIMLVGIDSEL
jgi:serine/threonine protein phosphatase PrpC